MTFKITSTEELEATNLITILAREDCVGHAEDLQDDVHKELVSIIINTIESSSVSSSYERSDENKTAH
jgi:hypothetical protein